MMAMRRWRLVGATMAALAAGQVGARAWISYVAWKDPIEGAFTMEVPSGWKVTGGMYQFAPVDVRLQVDAGSPDGAIHVRVGDATLTPFVPPGPSSRRRGLGEGQSYEVNGVTYTVLRAMSGAQFSKLYVQSKLAKSLAGLQIGETKDGADLAQALGQPLQGGATIGETVFTFTRGGQQMHGACYARVEPGMGGVFVANPSVVLAPANGMDAATGVLTHMVSHIRVDAQWATKKSREAKEFGEKILHRHDETMAEMKTQYEKCITRIDRTAALWQTILNPPGR